MKNLIIFGDSYSTFEGFIPEGYNTYYPKLNVCKVSETWWWKLIEEKRINLVINDSWSGSTIGYTGYDNVDCSKSSSFIYRYKKLKEEEFFENNNIDMFIVFGGTNDSWSDAPLGEIKLSDWQEKDLYNVLPAISYFAFLLKKDFPCAEIIFVTNTEIKDEIENCIKTISKQYGIKNIILQDIEKEASHPTAKGMESIYEQISNFIK